VPLTSSPSTCHGSIACLTSIVTPSQAIVPNRGKRNSTNGSNHGLGQRIAERGEIRDDIANIRRDEVRQQPSIVQRGAPAHEVAAIRLPPEPRDERAQQQRLHEAHPRVRRHLERAKLEEAQAAGCRVGGVQLVDRELGAVRIAREVGEEVAQQPVDEPRRCRRLACRVLAPHLLERDFELVEAVVARFVDPRRLTRRSDERAREQVRQRRMVLPVRHQALQEVGRRKSGLSAAVAPPSVT
jgi:hypothetical protein